MLRQMKRDIKRVAFSHRSSSTVLMFHHIDNGGIIPKSGCKINLDRFVKIIDLGIPFM